MGTYLLIFVVVWLNALIRTFNHLHVVRLRYETAIPASLIIAFVDVCVIASVVQHGLWIFIPVGLGFGFGQITAMKIYSRYRRKKDDEPYVVVDDEFEE